MRELEIIDSNHLSEYLNAKNIYVSPWVEFEVDLSKFHDLKKARLYGKSCTNIGLCESLEDLILMKIDRRKDNLSNLVNLRQLDISEGNITDLSFLQNMPKLKVLKLAYLPKLVDVNSIKHCDMLEEIEIASCKNADWHRVLGHLKNIHKLILDGCVFPDIHWVSELPNLSHLSLIGSNVLDGDISSAKNISYVSIDNRRHYNYKFVRSERKIRQK